MAMNFINLKIQSLSGLKSCDTSISYFKDYLPYQHHWVLHSITFELRHFLFILQFSISLCLCCANINELLTEGQSLIYTNICTWWNYMLLVTTN
jgi:hypothetical protein